MRRIRPLFVAAVLVLLAAGIGTTIALTTRRAPAPAAAAAAGEAAGLPVAAAQGGPTGQTEGNHPGGNPSGNNPSGGEASKAVAAARAFLARELGMTDLVAQPFRAVDARTGEVGFRHRHGEGGRLLPQTGPPAVTVRLYRLPAGWWVIGVQGRSIRVDSPARLQRISSPLKVAGKADVYEATVSWKVTQERPGRDLVLGQGFLTGLGGQISFRQPSGDAPGWVIFYEESAATGGGIVQATAVRVRFAAAPTPAPRIHAVTSKPRLRTLEGGWHQLPDGAGTVVLSVQASNAQRVRFVLTPTGTGTGPYGRLLGEDRDPRDGFSLTWRYPDESLSAHLVIQATGPGGTSETLFDVVHP